MQISMFDGGKPFKINKPIRLIELFAGIGAQAKALKRLGIDFQHYRVCEYDKYAIKSYNAIHGTDFQTSDIRELTAKDLGITDTDKYCYIMTYSFPCTDLSKAGKQKGMGKGSGTRSGLLWEVEKLLDNCKELPQMLLMENVPDVIGTKNMPDFAEWIAKLETLGYKNYWRCLNAKNYGIPQNRDRCFMVSLLGDYYYEFPKPFPLRLRLENLLEKEVLKKYYIDINDKYIKDLVKNAANRQISKTVRSSGHKSIDRHSWDVVYGIYAKTSSSFSKPGLKSIARTLKANHIAGACTNGEWARYYTPLECWRLMGFDDSDFYKAQAVNSNSQLYKQAGNSICVNVLVEIFKQIKNN